MAFYNNLGRATLKLDVSDELMAVAKMRAAKSGFDDVSLFVVQQIPSEASGGPDGLTVGSDGDLKSILESRLDGPFFDFHRGDFEGLRAKLRSRLDAEICP